MDIQRIFIPFFLREILKFKDTWMAKNIQTVFAEKTWLSQEYFRTRSNILCIEFSLQIPGECPRVFRTFAYEQYIARVADNTVVSENHGGSKISTGETSSALNN